VLYLVELELCCCEWSITVVGSFFSPFLFYFLAVCKLDVFGYLVGRGLYNWYLCDINIFSLYQKNILTKTTINIVDWREYKNNNRNMLFTE
jgi:hypothetical protein